MTLKSEIRICETAKVEFAKFRNMTLKAKLKFMKMQFIITIERSENCIMVVYRNQMVGFSTFYILLGPNYSKSEKNNLTRPARPGQDAL